MTSCQLASAGPVPNQPPADSSGRKIFVANVLPHINPDALRMLFSKFGEIEEGPLGFDSSTGKFKGFAIFVYKTIEGCNKALEEPVKMFEGCQLQCRRVTNKNQNQNQVSTIAPQLQQSDVNTAINYGVNPGFYAPNMNQAAMVMMGQNPAIGLANPMLFSAMNQSAFAPSVATGMANQSLRMSGSYGINSVSPSVIGSYAPQAALQGMGAYQSGQLGYSSVGGATAAVAARSQPGLGTTYSSYLGR